MHPASELSRPPDTHQPSELAMSGGVAGSNAEGVIGRVDSADRSYERAPSSGRAFRRTGGDRTR
jgi:hypothetical protein